MDFLYVANALDLNTGELLDCRKIGIALSDIDKRISTLNSTKMPISVELEAGYDFTGLNFNARDAEYIIHSVLAHDRVNGEWFKDPYGDLVDRVRKAALRMGAKPVVSDDTDIKKMNEKQHLAREKMEEVIGPIANALGENGVIWEYMTWKVGVETNAGRLHINVNNTDLRLILSSEKCADELKMVTGLPWRQQKEGKRKSVNISSEEVLSLILKLNTFTL